MYELFSRRKQYFIALRNKNPSRPWLGLYSAQAAFIYPLYFLHRHHRHRRFWIQADFNDAWNPRLRVGFVDSTLHGAIRLDIPVPEPLDLQRFLEAMMNRKPSQPTVVLMDHIDKALAREESDRKDDRLEPEFWEGLRSLASDRGDLAYIMASRERAESLVKKSFKVFSSPFFNIFGHILELGPLQYDEARELIASSPRPFPPGDVAEIIKLSGGLPLPLQILCSERLYALETEDRSDGWRANAMKRIEWSCRPTATEQ